MVVRNYRSRKREWRYSLPIRNEGGARSTPAYQAAGLTLDLACSVALADGAASGSELIHLTRQIDSWTHLSVAHRKRLKAHLRVRIMQPSTLAGLKKKLEPLPGEAKRTIAKFLAHLAEADGTVSPEEGTFFLSGFTRRFSSTQSSLTGFSFRRVAAQDSDSIGETGRSVSDWIRARPRADCPTTEGDRSGYGSSCECLRRGNDRAEGSSC